MEQDKVLETVLSKVEYEFEDNFLIKPLPVIKVTKDITEPVPTGEFDKAGYEIMENKTETKEVDSDFREGVILAVPDTYHRYMADGKEPFYHVGDTIIYREGQFAKWFDLFKDTVLLKQYELVGKKK